MKLKKFLATICAAGLLMTGCGGEKVVDKPADNSAGDSVKLGMITHLNIDEIKMGEILDKFDSKTLHQPKFYDSLKLIQMGIESGEIDRFSTYKSVAEYIVSANDKLEIVPNDALNKLNDNFCFAVRKEDTALKADLDRVIGEMKADGSLDKLVKEYITDVDKGQAPPQIEIPAIDGAATIKVGVTGDLPPLDYVSADGNAAGFNTAMLAEIAKRLNRNIKIIDIDSAARAIALTSKQIDVVFWVIVPFGNNEMPADIDKPEGLELSAPYFKDNLECIRLKK